MKKYRTPKEGECFYCGDPADTVDHVIPDPALRRDMELPETVPACRDCNTRKRNRIFVSPAAICLFIADQISYKYARLLRSPSWSDEDLEEVEPTLREVVLARQRQAEHIRLRLHTLRLRGGQGRTKA